MKEEILTSLPKLQRLPCPTSWDNSRHLLMTKPLNKYKFSTMQAAFMLIFAINFLFLQSSQFSFICVIFFSNGRILQDLGTIFSMKT